MTLEEARLLKPGEMSGDRDYYRTVSGMLVKNMRDWSAGTARGCRGGCALWSDVSHGCPCALTRHGIACSTPYYAGGRWVAVDDHSTQRGEAATWVVHNGGEIPYMLYVDSSLPRVVGEENSPWHYRTVTEEPKGSYEAILCFHFMGYSIQVTEVPPLRPADMSSPDREYYRNSAGVLHRWEDCDGTAKGEWIEVAEIKISSNAGGVSACTNKNEAGTASQNERDNMSNSITKAEKAAATNTAKQAFGALTGTIQRILQKAAEQDPSAVQYLNERGEWRRATDPTWGANKVYRVHPEAATAADIARVALSKTDEGDYRVASGEFFGKSLFAIAANAKCTGIVYIKSYVENTQTSLNLAYGTPVAVLIKA